MCGGEGTARAHARPCAHQGQDRPHEPLRLAHGQAEDEPEDQRGLDRHIREPRLLAGSTGGRRSPRVRGIGREPQGHVTSLDERSLVLSPVPDAIRCLVFPRDPRRFCQLAGRGPGRRPRSELGRLLTKHTSPRSTRRTLGCGVRGDGRLVGGAGRRGRDSGRRRGPTRSGGGARSISSRASGARGGGSVDETLRLDCSHTGLCSAGPTGSDVLQPSRSNKSATGRVAPASSHAATSNSLWMN